MRSSFMVFLIGIILGSTLGIGGIWTQVVQPAAQEIKELNEEHMIMESALDEAGEALREVAENLRSEGAPAPITAGSIFPTGGGTSSVTPTGPTGTTSTRTSTRTQPKEIAERLDTLATKLDSARRPRGSR